MRKKRILYTSNFCKMFTGFGKNTKNVLLYLQKTGKYELLEYAQQISENSPQLQLLPWKAIGAIPSHPAIVNELNQNPGKAQRAAYGEYNIEKAVKEFKPDIGFFVEDAWGVSFNTEKSFWNKIHNVLWVTQDSLPLGIKQDAEKTKHYWTWANFAKNEFHRLGYTHVKNQYPLVDLSNFYNIGADKKNEIRAKFGISKDTFIVGDVFRNQLRKLTPTNGFEGYSIFKRKNPKAKSILLLITNFSEGWNIMELAKQYNIPQEEIWTAYVSSECDEYILSPFIGQEQKCPFSLKEKAMNTVSVARGVTEEALNEIYNIMDVFLHPATSGACELPCVEAAAAEKIILTADYSYGEDIIKMNPGSLKLEWAKYTEINSLFIKSSPIPKSIASQLENVFKMNEVQSTTLGKKSRKWAYDNYSIEVNGKKIEEFIDSLPFIDWDKIDLENKKNPDYVLPSNYLELSNENFIKNLYSEILKMNETPSGDGFKHWMKELESGRSRVEIYQYFISVAKQEIEKTKGKTLLDLVDKTDKKRGLILIKESIGDCMMICSLFESFHEQYPNTDLYICTEQKYFEIFEGNPYVYKLLPYFPEAEQELLMISAGQKDQLFHIYFHPAIQTQRQLSYLSNSNPLKISE